MTDRRVALVTGAARGIGAASVAALVAQGYAVVAVDSCAGEGPTRPDAVTYPLATREQLDAGGGAGGGRAAGPPLWQPRDDEQEALWQVDVRGVWTTAAVTVPLMLAGP
ncbi:MAG: SDR family NAD(P)-dependent oxidoreductase, partial [Rhodoferax sp.]|nr:SDR family NAD(P)-dependent oxidoreductase [Actinomycetota bacterium]